MILIEKQIKYQPYHHVKFVNMNTGKDILPSNQQQIIEQANLLIFLWEKLLKNKF